MFLSIFIRNTFRESKYFVSKQQVSKWGSMEDCRCGLEASDRGRKRTAARPNMQQIATCKKGSSSVQKLGDEVFLCRPSLTCTELPWVEGTARLGEPFTHIRSLCNSFHTYIHRLDAHNYRIYAYNTKPGWSMNNMTVYGYGRTAQGACTIWRAVRTE